MSSTRTHQPIRMYTYALTERRKGTAYVPYGCYKYESSKNELPGGLFHFVKDADSYVPTLHGLSADQIGDLKEVAICAARSTIAHRPFLNTPHLYEVELINTGRDALTQGDRFTVQLPNHDDVNAQLEVTGEQGYNRSVNSGIWGGLLATRKVNFEDGGDPVEEVIQSIKRNDDFDVFQLISPYTPQSILSMMTLVANGAGYYDIGDDLRHCAARAVTDDYNLMTINTIVENDNVKSFLRTVVRHAMSIVECVQGFAGGQVVRACEGYNNSLIETGERFKAQLNMNRWLL